MLSHMVCFGRHTITGLLRLQNRSQLDWTADYRFYAEDHFDEDKAFGSLRSHIEEDLAHDAPLVSAMDDSLLRKTGTRISGVRFMRDPMSPPFHVNFVRGLRVLQISAAVPQGQEGAARMVPIDFQHAALPFKPRKNAPAHLQEAYQKERARKNINIVGRERLAFLRQQMDQTGSTHRQLVVSVDGRFTNSTVLQKVPQRTTLIGRVRKDALLFYPPQEHKGLGRKRKYGLRCPTPEELLKDEKVPFQKVNVHYAGKRQSLEVKTLGPVYTQMDKAQRPLRLLVIKGPRYHLTRTKTDRREPAFLICTDPALPLAKVLQYYSWRWDIEVNFRDQKTILGVGQAQVRNPASNQNAPALAVAAYAILLLASLKTYGAQGKPEHFHKPRWDPRKSSRRATTNDLRNQVRYELWFSALQTHFRPLCSNQHPDPNGRKCELPLDSALFHTIR